MAEIEKKYSDFQKGECEEEGLESSDGTSGASSDGIGGVSTIDDKVCPTCEVDPDFKLPKQWFEIEEAYLHKGICEYHVRVYESEATQEMNVTLATERIGKNLEDFVIQIGALKILRDLDKPISAGTKQQVVNASVISDTYYGTRSQLLGKAYLVTVPAFNFDQIAPNEDPAAEDNDEEDLISGEEIIVQANDLYKKLRILRLTLNTYAQLYSMAQFVDGGFVIRQEDDVVQRINFRNTSKKIKDFMKDISDLLQASGYPRLGYPGVFRSKRPDRIKFVFKDSGNAFELKNMYVLPDVGCTDRYEKIKVIRNHRLRNLDNAAVYNFLKNLDQLWNDLTATETRPWLEWTLDYFYPKYTVDYGEIEDVELARNGLECLLEDQLGLGNGKIVDSLAREIMSAFDSIEMGYNKNACRELERLALPEEEPESKLASEERKDKMLARYEKELENKVYSDMVKYVDEYINSIFDDSEIGFERVEVDKSNVFKRQKEYGIAYVEVPMPRYFFKNADGENIEANLGVTVGIYDKEDIERNAKNFATTKFNNLEEGSFGDQIQNSPNFEETKEALKEAIEADNMVLDLFRGTEDDPENDFDFMQLIPIVGICGLSKMAGKALDCITNGISFDDFLDILIQKSFEFMKINTLDLFFNGLPADFKDRLNSTIAKEFGPDVKISDLLGIKKSAGGDEALKEFLKSKNDAKRVQGLFEKYDDIIFESTPEEFEYLKSQVEGPGAIEDIRKSMNEYYDREENIYKEGQSQAPYGEDSDGVSLGLRRPLKYEKWIRKKIKLHIKNHKKSQPSFLQATTRLVDSLVVTSDEPEELSQYEQSLNSLEATALGVKVDAVFDVVFDYVIDAIIDEFSLDDLLARLRSFPGADFLLDRLKIASGLNCPSSPIVFPPPNEFLKSLSVDVCDPHVSLTLPVINMPSINWRFAIQNELTELVREALFKLVGDIMVSLVTRTLSTLESALCNVIEAAGGVVAGAISGQGGNLRDNFLDALNEAFCNDGEDPATSRSRAEELADALFSPIMFDSGSNATGSGDKVSNIIGSVSSTKEVLEALVAREGEADDQFNTRVANAVIILAPEMRVLLGSPNQVAYFFRNLGSFLSPDDRERIRDLLDAGIPNLPTSSAICLTNEELDDWNELRKQLLQDPYGDGSGRGGLTPEQAGRRVNSYNRRAKNVCGDILDDLGQLDSGGPNGNEMLEKAVEREMDKDACNPNNLLSSGREDDLTNEMSNQATDAFYSNLERSLILGFLGPNGILGEALTDFDGNKEFGRYFSKILNPNYGNSQEERDLKRGTRGVLAGAVMDARTQNSEVIGQYPTTVGTKQRDEILQDGMLYDFGLKKQNVVYKFYDSTEGNKFFGLAGTQTYVQKVVAVNNRDIKNTFNYILAVNEQINEQPESNELRFISPVSVSDDESKYMDSIGFQYLKNQKEDIRKSFFNRFTERLIPLPLKDYSSIYDGAFEAFNKQVVEMLLTAPEADGGLPVGYNFGYVTEGLTADSMVYYNPGTDKTELYNLAEEDKTLGEFESDRVIALNPALYGGKYNNPPFYIEPRQFTGWLEMATKAFDSPSGCDPYKKSLINFQDISKRTKDLSTTLKNDPRLSQDPDCVKDTPFNHLMDKKTKAHMDGIVRTTVRSYVAEYFMKGFGLFSNLEMSSINFDQSVFMYMTKRMKDEMYDLGTAASSKKIRITREKYWYAFLEQCVEVYQRMIDVDGLKPPEEIMTALNEIQRGIDAYRPIDRKIRKKMRKRLAKDGNVIKKPSKNFDPLLVVRKGPVELGLQAAAYRLTIDQEEKANFFNGQDFNDLSSFDLRFAAIKKLKFFQKQYFIALYEKQATLVLSELVKEEYSRLHKIMIDGLSDKPTYNDLSKSIFSMMSGSSSRVGFNSFYADKQTNGFAATGLVPEVKQDNSVSPIPVTKKPQFIVERYARLVDREDPNMIPLVRNRPQRYVGVIPLTNLSEFVGQNIDTLEDNYLSDFFGDLEFVYNGSFKKLMTKGFTDSNSISRLHELNKGGEINIAQLQNSRTKYIGSRDFEDFSVNYDKTFLLPDEDPQPIDTFGSTGVKYGLRLSIVFPEDFLTEEDIIELRSNPDFISLSKNEKSYIFDDNSLVLPIMSEEVDVKDAKFLEFDPGSGPEQYDLECLINKMTKAPNFTLFMNNIFNLKQISSMLAIYCMETLMPSLGRKVAPEGSSDSVLYDRRDGKDADPEQEWDGTINKFAKNSLRRQFKSLYLSRTIDGASDDDDNGGLPKLSDLFQMGNPLDIFRLPPIRFPWWQKRRLRTKIYDANEQECADPKKDLS